MIQSVFVIAPEKDNSCIFYGQLDQSSSDADDLGNILGSIVDYAQNLSEGQIKNIQLSQGKFAYGKFGNIYMIFKIQKTDDFDEIKSILQKMAEGFLADYKGKVNSFDGDTSPFDGFSDKIQSFLTQKAPVEDKKGQISGQPAIATPDQLAKAAMAPKKSAEMDEFTSEEDTEEIEESSVEPARKAEEEKEEPKSGLGLLQTAKKIDFVPEKLPEEEALSSNKPMIAPEKRDAYANGIDEYMRDEVLWNESQAVMKEYTADFVEGAISKLQIFLSISIVHHYELIIDFENYPEKPLLEMSEGLSKELGPIENVSFFMKNWDPKIPPHIVEIVREFEKILMKLKSSGKLEATMEMPEAALPELKPLEKLPYRPFEKPVVIQQKPATPAEGAGASEQPKQDLSAIPKVEVAKAQPVAEKKEEKEPAKKEPQINEKEKQKLEEKKQKELEKEKKEKEKLDAEKRKQEEKEREKQMKLEKKDEKKKLKEILKEGAEDAKKEMKSGF